MTIRCDMNADCMESVTHMDEKGFVYCKRHGSERRQSYIRCRQLRPWELRLLRAGKPVPTYDLVGKPELKITFRCRDIGYGIEEGSRYGKWTGATDAVGKREFSEIHGRRLWLFDDELVAEERI